MENLLNNFLVVENYKVQNDNSALMMQIYKMDARYPTSV